jgi:hypothetical protein
MHMNIRICTLLLRQVIPPISASSSCAQPLLNIILYVVHILTHHVYQFNYIKPESVNRQ